MTTDPHSPRPARHTRLGAHAEADGTNVAVHSAGATRVEVGVVDDAGAERRYPLDRVDGDLWAAFLPGVGAGSRYGLRADGPPGAGRWDPDRLLLDPYARAVDSGDCDDPSVPPLGVVVDSRDDGTHDRPARTPLADAVVYECHVKGFTARHPQVPPPLRGTFAGLAHPAALQHLVDLGVTAVELLPVQAFLTESVLLGRGLRNYWGYSPIAYFAPHGGYSSAGTRGEQVHEFREMVRALHGAGVEVWLDVVYNHTAEGYQTDPAASFRGLDDATYYRHGPDGRYEDVTGCHNTLDLRRPAVLALVLDSLRYWVQEMHVDGFRFDLAPALCRGEGGFDREAAFLSAIGQDPVLREVTLVAEPWDVGPDGFRLGDFPPPWAEWNAHYRDTVRDAWRGALTGARDLGARLTGSADVFPRRTPAASVNFVTCHDGFTMADLLSYAHKHNEANAEGNADGENHNRSDNGGVEGPTDDPAVLAGRRRRRRAMLATLLLSAGVPMLLAGDELGRTQGGNNNAYCQDNATSWLDWTGADDPAGPDPLLLPLVRALVALRRASPVLRRRRFLTGRPSAGGGPPDVLWLRPDGRIMDEGDWWVPGPPTLGLFLDGRAADVPAGDGYLVWLHTVDGPLRMRLPHGLADGFELLLDTTRDEPGPLTGGRPTGALPPGATLDLAAAGVVLLRAVSGSATR